MSKAFTREDDNADDDLSEEALSKKEGEAAAIPGGKNYITPGGAERLRTELRKLLNEDRPKIVEVVSWAAGNGDRSENGDYIYGKRRLREIDRRIRFLTKRLEIAEIVDPTTLKTDQVVFGATVTVRGEDERERIFSIVGVDETDASKGKISWISPIGKALLKSRQGDTVTVRMPKGDEDLEIVSIAYHEITE